MPGPTSLSGYINHCADTAENWILNNPVVPAGVLCLEINLNNVIRIKLGDGISVWTSLPYKFDYDIGLATETEPGLVIRASNAEALNGTDLTKYISSAALKYTLDNFNFTSNGIILTPGTIPYKQILTTLTSNDTSYASTKPYGSAEPLDFLNDLNDIVFRMEHVGSATLAATHRRSSGTGTCYLRVVKNGTQLNSWTTTSTVNNVRTKTITFEPGDIIQIQFRSSATGTYHEVSSCNLLISQL